jgi:hypothetical protein
MTSYCREQTTSKAYLLFNGCKHALALEVVNQQRDFSEPGRNRGHRLRRGLDIYRGIDDTRHDYLLVGNCLVLPHQGGIFSADSLWVVLSPPVCPSERACSRACHRGIGTIQVSEVSLTAKLAEAAMNCRFLENSATGFQSCFSPEHLIPMKGFRCSSQRGDGFQSHRENRWRSGAS